MAFTPHFDRGTEKAAAASKAQSQGRADFFSLKSGERMIVRPLVDLPGIITIDVHMGVPTKPVPKGAREDKWPSMMSAVCRNATAFRVHDANDEPTEEFEDGYGDCYIHATMKDVKGKFGKSVAVPVAQSWGLFAVREAVREGGRIKGFRDVMTEYRDKDGKTHRIPKILIVSQAWSNFSAQFSAAAYMTDTICDRDFAIERSDNDYTIQPGPPVPGLAPGEEGWQRYTDALKLMDLSVEKVIADQSASDWYGRWFDPSWVDPNAKEGDAAEEEGAGEGAAATLDEGEAARLKAEMAGAFGPKTTAT